jgi:type II secretory pathway pseudopilin PulG
MGTIKQRGFTVIETMLFLAVSAVLIVALLAGAGTSINVQRYHDSIVGLQNVLQDQYFQTTNVSNIPPLGALTCSSSANIVIDPSSPQTVRGQGDCVVLGRLITIDSDILMAEMVVGHEPSDTSSFSDDIDELQKYALNSLQDNIETYDLEWGTQIAWPTVVNGNKRDGSTTPRSFSMLILRSPTSGLIYTFTSDGIVTSDKLKDMVVAGIGTDGHQSQQRLCIDSSGSFNGGSAIFIKSYASSSNAIEIRSNDMGDNSTC